MVPAHATNEQIDIHAHILPRVDDGARGLEESLEMLRMAATDGTSTIVATPHHEHVTPESVRKGVALLGEAAAVAGIDITILAGCEVKFSANLPNEYRAGELLTINDRGYLLVEFSFGRTWTSLVHTSLYALQLAGVTPVVAHAERYPAVQDNPAILVEVARMGIPIQVNSASLTGDDGERARFTAEKLIQARMAHLLASDGHRVDKRKPLLADGFARVTELTDDGRALQMRQNAAHVITGRGLNLPEPEPIALRTPSRFHRVLKQFTR